MKLICILTLSIQLVTLNAFGQYTRLLDFVGATNGSFPQGDLTSAGTFLYGMTYTGGVNNLGTVFRIKPDGTEYAKLLDFTGFEGSANGSHPQGSLISDGPFLYGMTRDGGVNGVGVIFKIMLDGTGYTKLLDFAGSTNGSLPTGSLISDGTFLYGMTNNGSPNLMGTVFKIKLDGTGYAKLLDFAGTTNGGYPEGSLISDGTFLYGMTRGGGANNSGTIFKIKPDGTGYVKLYDFDGTLNGWRPYGSLILEGTFLFGMTSQGGTTDSGTIFKIKPDGSGYAKLHDFGSPSLSGQNPLGSLISDGTFLYGMTLNGGTLSFSVGSVFKIKQDGTGYETLLDFSGNTTVNNHVVSGSNPRGSFISDGTFLYGMTFDGGTNNGTIFKYALASIVSPAITNFTPANGPVGTTVVITGTNFSATPTDNMVKFNGTAATVTASSSTSITAAVPAGASTGAITVTVSGNTATSVSNFTVTVSPVITGDENQVEATSLKIFPNPVREELFIEVQAQSTLIVYDLMGRTLKSTTLLPNQNNCIETRNLSSGTYNLMIRSAGVVNYFRILKAQ